jgi:acyl dehydratase
VGSKVRTKSTLLSVDDKGDGRYLLKYEVVMEIEGQDKPAYVAESLSMFIT